jgi:hypothetical protein
VILAALDDAGARATLAALAGGGVAGWLPPEDAALAPLAIARARRAVRALGTLPPRRATASLDGALTAAECLHDAHLYFEVHELLEPHWQAASGEAREALQGLIQAAVGWQHLANGNRAGARALLADGRARLRGRRLGDRDLDAYAEAVATALARLDDHHDFDWGRVPPFPRAPGRT